jgi:hypothetical protein
MRKATHFVMLGKIYRFCVVLGRKLPLEQWKSNCFKEEGMPISINI